MVEVIGRERFKCQAGARDWEGGRGGGQLEKVTTTWQESKWQERGWAEGREWEPGVGGM